MASSIAATTIMRSIDFSRATASADLQQFQAVGTDGHVSLLLSRVFKRRRDPLLRALSACPCAGFSRTSASVNTSLASPMSASGSLAMVVPSSFDLSSSRTTYSPSMPASLPLKRLRPSSGTASSTFASCPVHFSKSERRTSGRSIPGDETSRLYAASHGVLDIKGRREIARQDLAIADGHGAVRTLGHDLQGDAVHRRQLHAHQPVAEACRQPARQCARPGPRCPSR